MSAYQNTQYQAVGNNGNNNNYTYAVAQEQKTQNRRSKLIVRTLHVFAQSIIQPNFTGHRLGGGSLATRRDWRGRGRRCIEEPQEHEGVVRSSKFKWEFLHWRRVANGPQ